MVDQFTVASLSRIVFAFLLLIKAYKSFGYRDFLWSHFLKKHFCLLFYVLFGTWVFSILAFGTGILPNSAPFLLWLSHLILFRVATLYTLEDILFHILNLYFVFAESAKHFTLYSYMEPVMLSDTGYATEWIPEVFLLSLTGLLLFGAGWTKRNSPMWRAGMGTYYFFINPKAQRVSTDFLTNRLLLMRIMNYSALLMELCFLPACLINLFPLGFFFWLLTLGFSIFLIVIVNLRWIGELIGLILMTTLPLFFLEKNLLQILQTSLALPLNLQRFFYLITIIGILFSVAWTTIIDSDKLQKMPLLFTKMHQFLRNVARLSSGMVQIDLFTERHLTGMILYRVFALQDNEKIPLLCLYDDKAYPVSGSLMETSSLLTLHTKIGEFCLELDHSGKLSSPSRIILLNGLVSYLRKKAARMGLPESVQCQMEVMQLVNPLEYSGKYAFHEYNPWKPAFLFSLNTKAAEEDLRILSFPIIESDTGRRLERDSCVFNPYSS